MDTAAHARADLEFLRFMARHRLQQWLFNHCYRLYSPLYTLYKKQKDRFALDLFRRHLTPGNTVLDIGANIGIISTHLAKAVGPAGRVHAFEPESLNFRRLQKRAAKYKNISVYPMAVADRSGTMSLYKSDALNVDHRLYDDGAGRDREEVKATTIDSRFCNAQIDLIKLDIQGFEYQALQGMRETLRNNARICIYLECWPYALQRAGASATRVIDLLQSSGFTVRIADAGHKCLDKLELTPGDWQALEKQPRVEISLWCAKETSAGESVQ